MSSQNNNSRKSLNRLSNYILTEQNIDIKNYTVGHLNENHLSTGDFKKTNKKWKTSEKPLKKAAKRTKPNSKKLYSSMSDINEILADFTDYDSSVPTSNQSENLTSNKSSSNRLTSGLIRLPHIDPHRTSNVNNGFDNGTMESDAELNYLFPVTDKEMAMSFLNGPFKGASKTEKFNNFSKFEKVIIQKEKLTAKNTLYSIDSVTWLEKKLESGLEKLQNSATSDHKFQINIYRLDIFNNIFEQIILDSKLFGGLLNKIKIEYDEYLFYLLRNQQLVKLNHKNVYEKLHMARSLFSNKLASIKEVTREISGNEKVANQMCKENIEIEKKIASENEFTQEQKQKSFYGSQLSMKTHTTQSFFNKQPDEEEGSDEETDTDNEEFKVKKTPKKEFISENLEATKFQIMQKIENIEEKNEELKKDYVPMVIINNLNQSIKDTEMEINKRKDQNKYLISKSKENENKLRTLLIQNDKTEFSQENTELLLKMISNFGVLVSNSNNTESVMDEKSSLVKMKTIINTDNSNLATDENEEEKFRDDYFS